MNTIEALNLTAFLVSAILLGYSAYSDLKTREVSNYVWSLYLPLSAVILTLRLFVDPNLLTISIVSIAITMCLSLVMFYTGIFGGADSKAFICLSIALPTQPFTHEIAFPTINPILPISILYNAYFFSLSVVLYALIRNADWKIRKRKDFFLNLDEPSLVKKAAALLSGYKVNFQTLRQKIYLYPMEQISIDNGQFRRSLTILTNAETDREDLIKKLEEYQGIDYSQELWATPGLPFLFFGFLALLFNVFFGDVLLWIVFQTISWFL